MSYCKRTSDLFGALHDEQLDGEIGESIHQHVPIELLVMESTEQVARSLTVAHDKPSSVSLLKPSAPCEDGIS